MDQPNDSQLYEIAISILIRLVVFGLNYSNDSKGQQGTAASVAV